MGWTGTTKYENETIQEFVNREIKYYPEYERIGKGFYKNRAFYGAVRNKNTNEVFAEVIIFEFGKKEDYINIYYKEMDETMGPYNYDCPDRILDILTPTSSEYAQEWRKKCRERNAKNRMKFAPGMKVKFKNSFTFSGGRECDTFIYTELRNRKGNKIKRLFACGENGGFYTTAGLLKKYEYEVIAA